MLSLSSQYEPEEFVYFSFLFLYLRSPFNREYQPAVPNCRFRSVLNLFTVSLSSPQLPGVAQSIVRTNGEGTEYSVMKSIEPTDLGRESQVSSDILLSVQGYC